MKARKKALLARPADSFLDLAPGFGFGTSDASPGGGGHFHINLYETCRFSGYHFSA